MANLKQQQEGRRFMFIGFGACVISGCKKAILAAVLLILMSACGLGDKQQATEQKADEQGFTLPDHTGKIYALDAYRGAPVVLNFWASWCAPCRQELPLLDALQQQYKDQGVRIWAINVDELQLDADAVLDPVTVNFTVLYDPASRVAEQYKVRAMPTTVFIDADGAVYHSHMGYKKGDIKRYRETIEAMLIGEKH